MPRVITGAFAVLITAVGITAFVPQRLWAEGTAEPGPHAANFKLLNNGSGIDEYTGSFSWNHTLLTVPGRGGLDFPITLTYNGGIGVEQEASWVGLGFGLNLGSIERSVVFQPDDAVVYFKKGGTIYQHDGWLFDDNYSPLPVLPSPPNWSDSLYTDGPDMWTVAVSEFGSNLCIVTDSSNMFWENGIGLGPAGKTDRAHDESNSPNWKSRYQRSYGIALQIDQANYTPEGSSTIPNNERQRHCYVSPPMGSSQYGRSYNYSGAVHLAYNDTTNGYGDNAGQCSVYVHVLPSGSTSWTKYGPMSITASNPNWLNTGIPVETGDRFAILCKSRKFVFENWRAATVDYDVAFTDWEGYYLNPEVYTNPYNVFQQGFTPRIASFAITSVSGRRYEFKTSDYVKATLRRFVYGYDGTPTLDTLSSAFDQSYKLTAILSHDYYDLDGNKNPSDGDMGSWVRIEYDDTPIMIDYSNKSLRVWQHSFQRLAGDGQDSVWQRHYIRYPRLVETPTHKVLFYLSDRDDNLGIWGPGVAAGMRPQRLDSLVLYAKPAMGDSIWVRSLNFEYANSTQRPQSFNEWQAGDGLAWHTRWTRCGAGVCVDSIGKLTLLRVSEEAPSSDSIPALTFRYASNPRYDEQASSAQRNPYVDTYVNDEYSNSSYYGYGGGYQENWGYYRPCLTCKPGDDQRAWTVEEIHYPSGGKEVLDWESNRYLWWGQPGNRPGGTDVVRYRWSGTNDARENGGVERGGIRLHSTELRPGIGPSLVNE